MNSINRILIIKLRAIGDVVLSTIVIKNLRSAFPNASIDFLTEDFCNQVVDGNPHINQVLVLYRKKNRSLPWYRRWQNDVRFLLHVKRQHYDLVFDFFGNPRSAFLTFISGARQRVGYDYRIRQLAYTTVVTSRAKEVHEAPWHLDALQAVGIPVISRELDVHINNNDQLFAAQFLEREQLTGQRLAAVNFSGGWPAKKWPLGNFAILAERITEQYQAKILVLWGPGEKPEAEELQKMCRVPLILIPETSLKQLGAILTKIQLLVTTDSGPMHLAAAVSTPCVALFGPTNYRLQGPFGACHEVVAKTDLDCLGCNRLDCDHNSCMQALTVDMVFSAVTRCVARNNLFEFGNHD
ncbi:MAG TPA: glycosyltransferase family 9 protein [bacterium]|nr:glycosyltransferase family 9 protein [bacterium]HPN42386.1 glycosyltransferase family 9 protein [bacterium]